MPREVPSRGNQVVLPSKDKAAKFQKWVGRKDKYEKAVEILNGLNVNRATDDTQWFEVAVSLAAIDFLLKIGRIDKCDCQGICRERAHLITRQRHKCPCPALKCSICDRCIGTSSGTITKQMEDTLDKYRQSPEESITAVAKRVSSAGEGSLLNKLKVAGSDVRMAAAVIMQCSVEIDQHGKSIQRPCSCSIRSLGDKWIKWTKTHHAFDRVKLSKEKAMTFGSGKRAIMDHDEKEDCYYMTVKWAVAAKAQAGDTAKIAARRCLSEDEKKTNALLMTLCRKYWKKAQQSVLERIERMVEKHLKERAEDDEDENEILRTQMEIRGLNQLGLKRMLLWQEKDIDDMNTAKQQTQHETAQDAASSFNGWLRKKDSSRLRVPVEKEAKLGGKSKPLRFDFSSGKGLVRPKKTKLKNTSVALMKGSGLKYIHADRDYDESKKALEKKGFLAQQNFESPSDYQMEKRNNSKFLKKKADKEQRQKQSQDSFTQWVEQKSLREKALEYLKDIAAPENLQEWLRVGKALKQIDRTLLEHWIKWTNKFVTQAKCRMYWDSFAPIACDIHTTSSAIRDTFLKLLHRKKINFKQAFHDFCLKYSNQDHHDEPEEVLETLTRAQFHHLLRNLGIIFQKEQVERLIDCFDKNGDGTITMAEFLAVTGEKRGAQCHGDTEKALKDICMWETVCHECGMQNAFQLVSEKDQDNGRKRAELGDHRKRRLLPQFQCSPILQLRQLKEKAPASCQYSMLQKADRTAALKELRALAQPTRESKTLESLMQKGTAPGPPVFYAADDDSLDPTQMLLLRWDPPKITWNNGPTFYVLETSGAEGSSTQKRHEYREIYRDPKDYQDNDGHPRYQYVVKGLKSNCRYTFRIRAINGFGAGPYVIGMFATCPEAPPAPIPVKQTSTSISLRWDLVSQSHESRLMKLREIFDDIDADGNGEISRDEFMEEIERRRPRLLEFLQRTTLRQTSSDTLPMSVFDAIETDDNEVISWEEFVGYFEGMLDLPEKETRASTPRTPAAMKKDTQCKFVLKKCVDEASGIYEEVYRGAKQSFTVHRLEPARAYQFRVQALNMEEKPSLHSEPTVVSTLLTTPAAPVMIAAPDATSVTLKWKMGKTFLTTSSGTSTKKNVDRLLEEWAGVSPSTNADGYKPIDLKFRFDSYDHDGSGYLDLPEFKTLLEELGVEATNDKIALYLEEFDINGDGRFSYDEFAEWWHKTNVHYVLKRSEGIPEPEPASTTRSSIEPKQEINCNYSVVCYRGEDRSAKVLGLQPNTKYGFRLRYVSSYSRSMLSNALQVITAPVEPSKIGRIALGPTWALLRWYPGTGGAHKYVLEAKFIEALPDTATDKRRRQTASGQSEWKAVYEGMEEIAMIRKLQTNSAYRFRVCGLNCEGSRSDFSPVIQVCTESEDTFEPLRPSNAAKYFICECTDENDVMLGDTLLFTEQLHDKKVSEAKDAKYDPTASTSSLLSSRSSAYGGEVIGERTVAARVMSIVNEPKKPRRKNGRLFTMSVIWSTAELYEDDEQDPRTRAAKKTPKPRVAPYILNPDRVITRKDRKVFRYETFRTKWEDEDARRKAIWLTETSEDNLLH